MATELLRERLPLDCHLGVTQDGRVFFIDDRQRTTSWLHPSTGQPVETGLHSSPDLPAGWEQSITNSGRVYYVDHIRQLSTFNHPAHGRPSSLLIQPPTFDSPGSQSFPGQNPESPQSPGSPSKENFKRGTAKQRSVKAPSAKRNPDSTVVKRGWLHRLESSGISKGWKRRWCVLAEFALFVYKGDAEDVTLASILLPSYRINPCTEADNIKRHFVFKVEHENTKTLYFAAEDSSELMSWMSLLRQSAMMNVGFQREANNNNNLRQPGKPVYKSPLQDRQHGQMSSRGPEFYQHGDQTHRPDAGLRGQHYNSGNFDPNQGPNPRFSQSSQSPSYKGYGDPASSPLARPTDGSFSRPQGMQPASSQPQRFSHASHDGSHINSVSNMSNYGSQAHSVSARDYPSDPNQSQGSFHGAPDRYVERGGDPRFQSHHQPQQHQQQHLRDGFEPDSARNSLAQSDASHHNAQTSYHPAQAERQRLQQHLGHPAGNVSMDRRTDPQRDSYSDIDDGRPRQLNPWDQNFPSVNAGNLRMGSFHNLVDGGKKGDKTFNTRSKSHENFSGYLNTHQQPQQPHYQQRDQNPADRYPSQPVNIHGGQGRQPMPRDGSKGNYPPQSYASGSNFSSPQSNRPIDLQHRSPQELGRDVMGSGSNPRLITKPQETRGEIYPDRRSYASNSSGSHGPSHHLPVNNSSFREPGSGSYRGGPNLSSQHPHDLSHHSQMPNASINTQGHQEQPDFHLNLSSQHSSPHGSHPYSHTYVNFPNRDTQSLPAHHTSHDSNDPSPGRPPYPTAVRQQIVEEMAQARTPSTQKDFLTSTQLNMQRMQEPSFFQYPSPRDKHDGRQSNVQSNQSFNQQHSLNNSRNEPNSRLSSASRTSQSSRADQKDDSQVLQDSFSRTNMMDPEAQKLRMAYERVHSLRMAPDKARCYEDLSQLNHQSYNQSNYEETLSQHHRAYKSSDELDRVGSRSPPMGSYHRIQDEPEDLYSRGSAFRPPSSLSGSHFGSDSLKRMKQLNATDANKLPKPPRSYHSDLPFHGDRRHARNLAQGHDHQVTANRHPSWQDSPVRRKEEFEYEDDHLFFEPYVNFRSSSVRNEIQRIEAAKKKMVGVEPLLKIPAPPKRKPVPIQTVKEDPNMSDREVLETNLQKIAKKNPLAGPRLRMSISAGDLIGKTHDELVLLLIQLRRNQAALENTKDFYRSQIEQKKAAELEYKRQMHQFGDVRDRDLLARHQSYKEAKGQMDEIENKLEVYKPIINLLDNMVTMGSLYGGDNLMLATQYRKHLLRPDQFQPPKKMLEFSRQHQEDRLIQETQEEIRQLSSDEVDLEEKIDRLNQLDHLLQEQSFKVSSFKEDKELMERALNGVLRQQDQYSNDPREMKRLAQQQRTLEKEISRVTQQLAEASKELEETTAENNKLEHDVALLRTKVQGELTRSRSAPSLASENVRTKMQMEKELAKVEGIMQGLNKEGVRLSQAMSTIRRSSSSSQLALALDKDKNELDRKPGTYFQTDLDSGDQVDLASPWERNPPEGDNSGPIINHQRQDAGTVEDWDMEGADENTKRFFGLLPRDKPKGQTVRDVKRQAEQRKEREKVRNNDDGGEEIKLRVSNVDNEMSSIIHARIPSNTNGQNQIPIQWEAGHPLYENLPGHAALSSAPGTQSAPGSRRSSLILMAPKPFTPYQDKSSRPFRSELALNANPDGHLDSGIGGSNSGQGENSGVHDWNRQYKSAEVLNEPNQNYAQVNNNNKGEGNFYPYRNGTASSSSFSSPYDNHAGANNFNQQQQTGGMPGQVDSVMSASHIHGLSQPTVARVNADHNQDPPPAADHIVRPTNASYQSRAYTARPWAKPESESSSNLFNVKRNSRGRYLTISSSEPIKMEITPTLHSSAGDLILNRSIDDVPDIVKSSQTKVDQIDEDVIEREILFVPEKVLIPERYDAEADAEQLSEEEKYRRQERAERIKKLLTSQSVLSMSQPDVSHLEDGEIHQRVQQEKKERAHYLTLNQELARQVTLQSKKQAAERRKTWSGAQFADAKRQYEEELQNSLSSPLRSPDAIRKRSEITLHDL